MRRNARFVSVSLLVIATSALGGWSPPSAAQGTGGTGLMPYYGRAAIGYSSPRDAHFRDNSQTDCFLITGGVGNCTGVLNNLGDGAVGELGIGMNLGSLPGARADITFGAHGRYRLKGTDPAGTDFKAKVDSNTLMLSAYYELAMMNMGPLRPFVGGGVGVAWNRLSDIRWNDPTCCNGKLPGGRNTDFAWHLTLGMALAVHRAVLIEFMYRYMDMGDFKKDRGPDEVGASTGGTFNPSGQTGSATGKLRAHEWLVGARFPF